jgi:hypothetical protein
VQREALHHQLLLGQRLGVELEPDLLGFHQVPAKVERIGHLQRPQVHRGLPGDDVELAHVDLGAEQLGAHLLGGVPGQRLGEEPQQQRDHDEQQQKGADRLPAEELHAHRISSAGRGGTSCTPATP